MAKLARMNQTFWCVLLVLLFVASACRSDAGRTKTKSTTPTSTKKTQASKKEEAPTALRVYVGTYTGPKSASKGIYLYDFDLASGALKQVAVAAETASPSFLALSPDNKYLYA